MFVQIVLICSVWMIQKSWALNLSSDYLSPIIDESSVINLTQNVTSINSRVINYTWLRVNDHYIQRFSADGRLELFDLETNTLKYNIPLSSSAPTNSAIRYYVIGQESNSTLGIILEDRSFYVSEILPDGSAKTTYQVVDGSPVEKYATELTPKEFITLEFAINTNANVTQIWRRSKSTNYFRVLVGFTSAFSIPIFNMKVCSPPNNTFSYLIAIWKSNCLVQIIECRNQIDSCSQIYSDKSTQCSLSQYGSTTRDYSFFEWNLDCTKIIYESKSQGLKVVDLNDNSNIALFPYSNFNAKITGFWFFDDFDQFIGIATVDKFRIFNFSEPLKQVYLESFLTTYELISYSKAKRVLLISSQKNLLEYGFKCQKAGYIFQTTGVCNGTNVPNSTTNSSSNTSNTSNTSNDQNSTNSQSSSNSTANDSQSNDSLNNSNEQNQTENTTTQSAIFSSNQITNGQETAIGSAISTSFQGISYIASSTVGFLQIFPYSFLFMRFINFWAVCSMYIFPEFNFPTSLKNILLKIYQDINVSIFKLFSYNLPSLNLNIAEKFTQDQTQGWGFTSDVFNANFQNFLILLLSYAILACFLFLSRVLPVKNFFRVKLQAIDYQLAFIAQYISIMSTFMFNFPIISQRSYQFNFIEKVNLCTQNTLFCFSAFIPALTLIVLNKPTSCKAEKEELKTEMLDWFFDSMCNAIFPFVTIIRNIPLFLAFNVAFFSIPIYAAWRKKKCKIIGLVKSTYFSLFNLGVIILTILRESASPHIFSYVPLFLMIIIFVGAVHELLELIAFIFSEIFINLYILFSSLSVKENTQMKDKNTMFLNKIRNIRRNGVKFAKVPKVGLQRQSKQFQCVQNLMFAQDTGVRDLKNFEQKSEGDRNSFKKREKQEKIIVEVMKPPNLRNQSKIMKFLKGHFKTSH